MWFDVEKDVWVEALPDGTVRMGMTDPAQTRAGRILFVRARVGKRVAVGKNLATVESAKWVGPVPSPLMGTVIEANAVVLGDPNVINRDPYGAGWLVTFRPEIPVEQSGLLRGAEAQAAYRQKLKAEGLTCMRCADLPEASMEPEPDSKFNL
nr:glycine cleavage system protein H [Sulfobacillus harzensis]